MLINPSKEIVRFTCEKEFRVCVRKRECEGEREKYVW